MSNNASIEEDEMNGFMNCYQAIDNEYQPDLPLPIEINFQASNNQKATFCFYISMLLYISSILFFSIFLTFTIMKADGNLNWSYSNIIIYFYLSMVFLFLLGNLMIIKNSHLINNCLGKCFLHFCLNSLVLMVISFGLLINLKIEGTINWKFSIIFVPFYMIMSIAFLFICFILPGLIDSSIKMYKEVIVILSQYFSCLLTIILFLLKIDKNLKIYYSEIFILEEVMLLILACSSLKFRNVEGKYIQIENLMINLGLIAGFVCLGLKCDEFISGKWRFVLIPFYFIFVGLIIKSFRFTFEYYKLNKSS